MEAKQRTQILYSMGNHHHQAINAHTAGAQAFFMDYT
jgi:hypothetical protein